MAPKKAKGEAAPPVAVAAAPPAPQEPVAAPATKSSSPAPKAKATGSPKTTSSPTTAAAPGKKSTRFPIVRSLEIPPMVPRRAMDPISWFKHKFDLETALTMMEPWEKLIVYIITFASWCFTMVGLYRIVFNIKDFVVAIL